MLAAILKSVSICTAKLTQFHSISKFISHKILSRESFTPPRLLLNYLTFKGDKNSLKPQIYSSIKMRI